jgi:hypothetical protein
MAAAGQGNISVLEQLLALGADVGIKASNGWMARSIVQTVFIQRIYSKDPCLTTYVSNSVKAFNKQRSTFTNYPWQCFSTFSLCGTLFGSLVDPTLYVNYMISVSET